MSFEAIIRNIYSIRPGNADELYDRTYRLGDVDHDQLPDILDATYDATSLRYPFAMKNLAPRDCIVDLEINNGNVHRPRVRTVVDRVFHDGTAYVLPITYLNNLPASEYPRVLSDRLLYLSDAQARRYSLNALRESAKAHHTKRNLPSAVSRFSDS